MKTAITLFMLLPCLLFSQITRQDTANLPVPVQETVKSIVNNKRAQEELSRKINRELEKQLHLMQSLKNEIEKLKASRKIKPVDSIKILAASAIANGIKPEEYEELLHNPEVRWEQKPKSWFGRLFSSQKYRYFPYVITETSEIIYLKPKK